MLKSLVIKLAKKYIVDSINYLLSKNKDNTGTICEQINFWTTKLQVVIELLKKVAFRCSDGKLEDEEVKDSVKELEKIIKEW